MMKNNFYFPALIVALLFTACEKKDGNSNRPENDHNLQEQRLRAGASPIIVVIGASTAAGTGAQPIDSSWVNRLKAVVAQSPNHPQIKNFAKGGATSYNAMPTGFVPPSHVRNTDKPDTANNVTKALSAHPDLVMITYPSNDVSVGYTNKEILSNYAVITKLLDSAKVPYILFGLQPRNFTERAKREQLKVISDSIQTIYGERSNNYYSQLADPVTLNILKKYDYDHTHPNNTGHELILNTVLNHPIFRKIVPYYRL